MLHDQIEHTALLEPDLNLSAHPAPIIQPKYITPFPICEQFRFPPGDPTQQLWRWAEQYAVVSIWVANVYDERGLLIL